MEIINSEYQDSIDFLNDCAQACYECIERCLSKKNLKEQNKIIMSLMECAIHAQTTVGFLARKSEHSKEMALISAHLARVTSDILDNYDDEVITMTHHVCLETHTRLIEIFDEKKGKDD